MRNTINRSAAKNASTAFTLFASICIFAPSSSFAKMRMASNFWNITWGNQWRDYFNADVNWSTTTNPWNPQFLKEIKIYQALRFMDWVPTNGSTVTSWSQRVKKTSNHNGETPGVAYEWQIDLCNRNNSDMWVNVPHLTVNHTHTQTPCDYAIRLAILIKLGVDITNVNLGAMTNLSQKTAQDFIAAGGVRTCDPLNSNLKVYIEYSNECWNYGFAQASYALGEGCALGLPGDKYEQATRYTPWASVRVWQGFAMVMGDVPLRMIKVMPGDAGSVWQFQVELETATSADRNPWGIKPDVFSTAPYFGRSVDGNSSNALQDLRTDMNKALSETKAVSAAVAQKGMSLVCYEGGQHVTTGAAVLSRNSQIYSVYTDYLNGLAPYVTNFFHYCHVSTVGSGGAWGAMEQTGQALSSAHKYRALVDWAAANPTPVGERPMPAAGLQSGSVVTTRKPVTVTGRTMEQSVMGRQRRGLVVVPKVGRQAMLHLEVWQ